MLFRAILAAVLAVPLAAPLSAACSKGEISLSGLSAFERQEILIYLNRFKTTSEGLDAFTEDMLDRISTYHGVRWWNVFGAAMAAEEVLHDLKAQNYTDAFGKLSKYVSMSILAKSAPIKAMKGANSVAGLAALPIDISIKMWADMLNEKGMAFQKVAYRTARAYPFELSHEDILRMSKKDNLVRFDASSGYIMMVGDLAPKSYMPFRPDARMTSDIFYEMMRLSYEANTLREENRANVRSALRRLKSDMEESVAPTPDKFTSLTGTWSGYALAGSQKLDYSWDIDQQGSCVEGTISIKMKDEGKWSRYAFLGHLDGKAMSWNGTIWKTSGNGAFCMAAGVLNLDESGSVPVLEGSWGPNKVRGGCPRNTGGTIRLERDG